MALPLHISTPSVEYYFGNGLVVDFETTNKDKGSALEPTNSLVLASWARVGPWEDWKVHSCWGDITDQPDLIADIEAADFIVAHNAKFELHWLDRAMDTSRLLVWDTMLAEYVLTGNLRPPLDLDSCLKRRGLKPKVDTVGRMIKAGVCPSEIPRKSLWRYSRQDVRSDAELFYRQLEEVRKAGKLGVIMTRCILTPVLCELERTGMFLDADRVEKTYDEYYTKLQEVNRELHETTGGINPKSSKQVAEFLYDKLGFPEPCDYRGRPIKTPSGGRTTNAKVLSGLKGATPEQRHFLDLKRKQSLLEAAISKNLEFFRAVCAHQSGAFKGRFNQTATATHRLSSSGVPIKLPGWKRARGVQFQNFPRKFKPLFKARRPGYLIGEVDGAQLEFRVAAYCGRDKQAHRDISDGHDVHAFSASVLGVDRQAAKAETFKPLYGGMSGTKRQQAYYAAFRARYSELAETQKGWTYEVLEKKSLKLPWGMEFFWPDTAIKSGGYITNTQDIYNYPIQSLATAEIIPIAVVYLWHRLKEANAKSFLVNTIHDSAICEIHPDERELFKELAVKAFTLDVFRYLRSVYNIVFDVPLGVGMKIGEHWGESPDGEIKMDVENPEIQHIEASRNRKRNHQ